MFLTPLPPWQGCTYQLVRPPTCIEIAVTLSQHGRHYPTLQPINQCYMQLQLLEGNLLVLGARGGNI